MSGPADEPPLLIFWSHETVWCGLWRADDRFELRLVRDAHLMRVQSFRDPADAYEASVEWLHAVELGQLIASFRPAP